MTGNATPSVILGLLLAGGAGRRVGGADKGLLPLGERTLAEAAAECLRPQVHRLVISCNRNERRYGLLGDAVVRDRRPGFCGPLAGLEAALPHADGAAFIALAPCDVPALPENLVCTLRRELQAGGADVAYARSDGRNHYLCALLRQRAATTVTAYLDSGGRSVHGWYGTISARAVDFPGGARLFRNHNFRNHKHGRDSDGTV